MSNNKFKNHKKILKINFSRKDNSQHFKLQEQGIKFSKVVYHLTHLLIIMQIKFQINIRIMEGKCLLNKEFSLKQYMKTNNK
jgi:hypothetical protein